MNDGTDRPIPYLDTLMKTGSESIEAIMRRRRILFAEFVARMEDTRLLKCVVFGELVGGAGRKKKQWMDGWMDGVNIVQWTTAAQDEGKWRKMVEQGAEGFMAKWIAAEKARALAYGMQ